MILVLKTAFQTGSVQAIMHCVALAPLVAMCVIVGYVLDGQLAMYNPILWTSCLRSKA